MPVYVYESADGTQVEGFYPMDKAPKTIIRDKVRYRRIVAPVQVLIPPHMRASFKESKRHTEWFNSPETQKKLKEGQLEKLSKDEL